MNYRQTILLLRTVVAYLDDIVILGSSEEALAAFSDLKVILPSIGLSICDAKCEVYTPSGNLPPTSPISVKHDGIIILGCPLGNDHFTTSTCLSIAGAKE